MVEAVFEMAEGGVMRFQLFPRRAPITVASFVDLARAGFYDGRKWIRIVKDFVIQGGSADDEILTPCPFRIKGEFSCNGVDTGLDHRRGAISMSRFGGFDSAGSQIFVVHRDAEMLNGKFAAFGIMLDGFDELDRLAALPVKMTPVRQVKPDGPTSYHRPLDPPVIRRVTILADEVLPPVRRMHNEEGAGDGA